MSSTGDDGLEAVSSKDDAELGAFCRVSNNVAELEELELAPLTPNSSLFSVIIVVG